MEKSMHYIGVTQRGNRYEAWVRTREKLLYLGSFTSAHEAALERDSWVMSNPRSNRVRLNFPVVTDGAEAVALRLAEAVLGVWHKEKWLGMMTLREKRALLAATVPILCGWKASEKNLEDSADLGETHDSMSTD